MPCKNHFFFICDKPNLPNLLESIELISCESRSLSFFITTILCCESYMVGAKTFSTVSEWSVQTCPQQLLPHNNLNQITQNRHEKES